MVSNFSGPDRLSLLVGYLLHWNLLLAAYVGCFVEVVKHVIEIGQTVACVP